MEEKYEEQAEVSCTIEVKRDDLAAIEAMHRLKNDELKAKIEELEARLNDTHNQTSCPIDTTDKNLIPVRNMHGDKGKAACPIDTTEKSFNAETNRAVDNGKASMEEMDAPMDQMENPMTEMEAGMEDIDMPSFSLGLT